jgi:hypothetical protein
MELPKGMGVFKVSNYEFARELEPHEKGYPAIGMIRVRVKKMITKSDSKYFAVPEKEVLGQIVQGKNEYVGEGTSEAEALFNCIALLKDAPFSNIFPKEPRGDT